MSSITNIIGTKYQSLFDPKNFKNFRVDGILYKSIYHYVYSNLVHFDLDKKSLNNANTKDVYTEYLEIETNSRNQIIYESCEKAIESRFAYGDAADLLMGTGESILLYTSDNRELGTGPDMLGKNLYGKMLMNFRKKLSLKRETEMKEKQKEKIESELYRIYSVYLGLRKCMTKDLDDLSEFVGLSLDEIIEKLGKQTLFDITPSPDIIYSMYKKQEIQDKEMIDNPIYIVQLIRKKYIQQINTAIKSLQEKAIIESFVDWLIAYKSVEYGVEFNRNKIKYEHMNKLTSTQKERILRLYESGKLNESVKQQVDERLSVIRPVIKQEDIENARSFEIPVDVDHAEEKKNTYVNEKDNRPITKLQDSNISNDYFSNLFVKFFRQKTKREKQMEDEDIKEQMRVTEEKQIEEEIEKEIALQQLLLEGSIEDKKSSVKPIRKRRQAQAAVEPPMPRAELSMRQPQNIQPAYRPPSTIRFGEDPSRGYFGVFSPLAVDRTVFYVDNYAYPSIYHYIMTRLIEMLPTIKTMSKAHGYIMIKTDSTNVKTYKSFEILDKEYDELYTIERILKITELLEKCLPIALPPIEKINEMYPSDIDHSYTYNTREDILLGSVGKNNGYNIYGIELTKFIKSKLAESSKILQKADYKDSFIKKRLEDLCNTLKTVINIEGSNKPLDINDINNIIMTLYDPCFEAFKRNSDEPMMPLEYENFIREMLSREQVTNVGIDVLYHFVIRVYNLLVENIEPGVDVDKYISSMRTGTLNSRSFSCMGPYKTKTENCLFAGVVGMIEKLNSIHRKDITSDKLDYVFMLLTNNSERIDYVDIDDKDIPKVKSLLFKLGDSIVNNASSINGFIKTVSKNIPNDVLMRVIFFGIGVERPEQEEKKKIKLSKVKTIGDGSCFFHALFTVFPKYRAMSTSDKKAYTYQFRKDMAKNLTFEEFVSLPVFETLLINEYGITTHEPFNRKAYKAFTKRLASPSEWADHYIITYTARILGLHVIVIKKEDKSVIFDEKITDSDPKIYLQSIDENHFETLMDKEKDQYIF
jgi:predicted NAD-dependent protein-ADP-ribosyltransferase YbiA (DUF1768 family)